MQFVKLYLDVYHGYVEQYVNQYFNVYQRFALPYIRILLEKKFKVNKKESEIEFPDEKYHLREK